MFEVQGDMKCGWLWTDVIWSVVGCEQMWSVVGCKQMWYELWLVVNRCDMKCGWLGTDVIWSVVGNRCDMKCGWLRTDVIWSVVGCEQIWYEVWLVVNRPSWWQLWCPPEERTNTRQSKSSPVWIVLFPHRLVTLFISFQCYHIKDTVCLILL